MIEGLFSVEFVSNVNIGGGGVVVLETQRILGGDSSFVYIGDYELDHRNIKATIKCTNYQGTLESIFWEY